MREQLDTSLYEDDDEHEEPVRRFESGAVRSADVDHLRYDLISPVGLRRLAARYALGAERYGDHNYLKGMEASNVINHLMAHLEKFRAGRRDDDNLAAIAWGAFTLMHYEETRPHLMDIDSYPLRSVWDDGERMAYDEKGEAKVHA
jgi:hypothetical protein